jgi:phosphatidylinositol-bisphosphatase
MFALPRDEFYAYELKKQESSYTEALPLNLLCGSYNLAGLSDSEFDDQCLQDWLHSTRTDVPRVDIYCVGVQEIVPLDARGWFSGDSSERLERWKQRLLRRLGEDEYHCIASETLFGLAMWLFVHVAHAPHVHHVSTQTVGAGLLGTGGNKGGAAIRLSLYNSTLCFVNSHLAAHQNEVDMRNSDFQAIFNKLRFNVNAASPTADSSNTHQAAQSQSASIAALEVAELEEKASSSIFRRYATLIDHDFVFWLGDLNYRIDLPISEVVEAIHGKKWKVLLDADQLKQQQALGTAFADFLEQPIQFSPTYKFKKGYEKGNVYDTDKGDKKPPSYCDRVLYMTAPGDALCAVAYDSVPSCCASDHKPVRAEFELMVLFNTLLLEVGSHSL